MHQQPQSTVLSMNPSRPWPRDAGQLWLEEEDKEESKRLGELKEKQKKRQKLFEEQFKRRQEHAPGMPSPSGFAEDEKPI
jgi:hypothetical protein